MKVFAVIVGLLAMAMGGGCLMLVSGVVRAPVLLGAWLQLVIGGSLVIYAATRKRGVPFSTGFKWVVWLVGCALVAWVAFWIYVLATLNIH
ncbi:MAG: hypothetical protein HKN11_14215 [Rhizobiales bacterium]|nr:hypothetical protein [Hyphomicrobiales bacterium]